MVRIELSLDKFQEVFQLAEASYGHFRHNPNPPYGRNELEYHRIGKIGEMACEQWAKELKVWNDSPFREPHRSIEPDLILNCGGQKFLNVEVKSCQTAAWHWYGRIVQAKQMPNIQAKSHIVIWCVVDTGYTAAIGTIMGWNTIDDIKGLDPVSIVSTDDRQYPGYQVPVEQVRPIEELVNCLQSPEP